MGNAIANRIKDEGEDDDDLDHDPFDGIDTLGYRVLGVQPNSPAAAAGLVSFMDFLVGAQEKMLLGSGEELQPGEEYDDVDLPMFLNEHKGQEIEFCKYCSCRVESFSQSLLVGISTLGARLDLCPCSRSNLHFVSLFL
jgi:hypothetical protein